MILYWDASAIVKLLVLEPGSDAARAWFHDSDPFLTSRIAYAEVMAALGTATRLHRVDIEDLPAAESGLRQIWVDAFVVDVGQSVVEMAGRLAIRHGLRGYDAVHLATALSHLSPDNVSHGHGMVTWDARLTQAALAEGLYTFGDQMQSPPSAQYHDA